MKKKILVVDDNPQMLGLIADLLEDEGHQVCTAENGLSALDILISFIPDIMFIDLVMPKIGGDKLCKIIRKMQHLQDCYLVLVSAAAAEMDFDYTEIGADACIAKGPLGSIIGHVLAAVRDSDPLLRGKKPKPIKSIDTVHLRQMTKELLSQNRHWEAILDSMREGILETFEGRIVYANSAALSLFGISLEELLAAYPPDLFDNIVSLQVEKLMKSRTDESFEIGYSKAVKINNKLVTLKKLPMRGESSTSIIMITDVTAHLKAEEELKKAHDELELRVEQRTAELVQANEKLKRKIQELKQAQEALLESKERFRELAELLPETIFEMDINGNLTFVNRKAFDHFDYTQQDFDQGLKGLELFHPDDRSRAMKNAKKIISGENIGLNEYTAVKKDKSTFPALIHSSAIWRDGKPVGLRGFIIDITETKRLEAQLQHAHKMEAIGTLTGGIAHDFNNILGIIIGNTELALDDVPEWNPANFNLEEIKTASLRAKDIVGQLLGFAHKTDQKLKPIKLVPVIRDSLKFLRATLPTSVTFRQNIQVSADTVLANSTQIHQIMLNLYTNAAHAMEETGGILEISIQNLILDNNSANIYPDLSPGNYVAMKVSDTGPGISPEIKDRIFDPYFTTKEIGKGSGMGLSTVHGILQNHQGAISVYSEPGKGASFTVFFPVIEEEAVIESKSVEEIPTGNERILLIDDEKSIVNMAQKILERLGYQVETKQNPVDALELFRSKPEQFDLVVTDMTMPYMTGDKLVEQILNISPDMLTILCTGFSEKISEEKAQKLGIKAFVLKPLVKYDFAVTVRKVLDENIRFSGPAA
jgi:PAS domain S-box-containing protein